MGCGIALGIYITRIGLQTQTVGIRTAITIYVFKVTLEITAVAI
jgi:hypothetical protein